MKHYLVLSLFSIGIFLVSTMAQAVEVGERLAPWTLKDQFGDSVNLDEQTSLLLVASSRKAAEVMDEALKDSPEGYLEARNTLYVADISRIPGLVAKLVLVPAMRSANYRVLLDRESQVAPQHLGNGDTVLWLDLDDMKVQERREFESAEALRRTLEEYRS
ncbi:FAD/FMN-containing dehydrogenase [Pistricoccus aurantiacus]|uniref:FAD/FMN-containing dehydrogenase n=1 Tax=Pistricoccus aurantiacus TaxID=1883414 RepID=A0A5B8SN67_9GAMM|nr:FAD/FMN-containing dehydrogenase [Pistricoccus aurantiacus]QEA37701.1 FAD/FMN-containing dehydrogenase [Pistricoccus aurantiacus]